MSTDLTSGNGWQSGNYSQQNNDFSQCNKKMRLDQNDIDSSGGESSESSVRSPPASMPRTPPVFSPSSDPPISPNSDPTTSSHQRRQGGGLSQEHMQLGWRRCWSTRENRWYFFNKLTQRSSWEPPSDSTEQGIVRQQSQQQPYRKFVPSDEWDLSVASNVQMPEKVPLAVFAPHPDMEIIRSQAMSKMRLYFAELCHLKEILDVSSDTLNQWIMAQAALAERPPIEQLIPTGSGDEVTSALHRNLQCSVPVRMVKVAAIPDARRLLSSYAASAKKIVDTRNVTAEKRKIVKWHCESVLDWLRKSQYTAKLEEYLSGLSFLRSRCQQILADAMKQNIEFVCSRLTTHCCELASSLMQEQRAKLEACQIKIPEDPLPPPRPDKIVTCYSVQLRWPCAALPEVQMEQTRDDQWVKVTYKEDTLQVRVPHFYKLEQLYKHNCFDDRRYDCFLPRVWCLLKRYEALSTPGLKEGVKLQQSLPTSVSQCLQQDFGVTFECFASPLNTYFRQFCSLFADTDGYFGSRGSFFAFTPTSGSMQMNPPYCEEVMKAAVHHAEKLLENALGPMSFVIFLPDWREPLLEALLKAEGSKFWRHQTTLPPHEHVYRHGFRHAVDSPKDVTYNFKSSHATTVIVLQNGAGSETWPVDETKLAKLAACFKQPLKAQMR